MVEPSGPPRTILLVDDEVALRGLIGHMLQTAGFEVLQAGGGREALALVRAHSGPIDLLITDLSMPEMGGRELARRLEDLRPEVRNLYISGHTDEILGIDELEGFLEKPFTRDSLIRKVEALLALPMRVQTQA